MDYLLTNAIYREVCYIRIDVCFKRKCVAHNFTLGNFIDTSNNYQLGESETIIGEWMKKRGNRDEMGATPS